MGDRTIETIRFSLIGRQDLKLGTGTFEVVLADGRTVAMDEVDIGGLLELFPVKSYATVALLPATGTGTGIAGRLAYVTATDFLYVDSGTAWTGIGGGGSHNHAGSDINSSVVAVARGGTGQDFSATAQGVILYFSTAGTVAALSPGTSGQFLKTQGAAANPAWADIPISVNKRTSDTTSDATTNELTAYTVTVPGATLSTSNMLRVTLLGKIKSSNATRTCTMRLKYGGTTLATIILKSFDGSDAPLIVQGYVAADGATNAQIGQIGVLVGAGAIIQDVTGASVAAGAINSTSDQTLAVTFQLSIGEAATAWTIQYVALEKVV